MKKMVLLCLVLVGCYPYQSPFKHYVYEPPVSYVEGAAKNPAPATRVIKRTVKRTIRIVPASELKGVLQ